MKLEVRCSKCDGDIKLKYCKASDNILLYCVEKCNFQVGYLSRVKVIK